MNPALAYNPAMATTDSLEILLAHDRWASIQLLNACEKLTADQFHHPFEIGPGTLHNTTAHIVGAIQTWVDTLAGREPGARIDLDGKVRTPAEILSQLELAHDALSAEAYRLPMDVMTQRRLRSGKTVQASRSQILVHVTTHGMHHRAQCLNILRQLGINPLPPSSVVEWIFLNNAS